MTGSTRELIPALGLSFVSLGEDGDSTSKVLSGSVAVTSIDFDGRAPNVEGLSGALLIIYGVRDINVLLGVQIGHEVVNGIRL
jgi:hypothetical protein